jgi:hypothetical protein
MILKFTGGFDTGYRQSGWIEQSEPAYRIGQLSRRAASTKSETSNARSGFAVPHGLPAGRLLRGA